MASRGPVLILEENDDVRMCLSRILESHGYATKAVLCEHEALRWLREGHDPSLILLDSCRDAEAYKGFLQALALEFPVLFESLPVVFSRGMRQGST